jgi:cobalt-zinc-cadmium efflux system protein
MQAVPKWIELAAVEEMLTSLEGVISLHDLHIWSVTDERAIMSAHLTIAPEADRPQLMGEIERLARDRFEVHHSTIQLDCPEGCSTNRCQSE